MKLTFKEKVKLFWDRNKVDIIGWLIGAGVITGIGCAGAYIYKKQEEKRETEQKLMEDMIDAMIKAKAAEEAEKEEIPENIPDENRLTDGGYFESNNDHLDDVEYPNILVNTVPISSMGQFGIDVLNLLNVESCGEFADEHGYKLETTTVDVYVDFGHEVWKRNHPEEAESQEKQTS